MTSSGPTDRNAFLTELPAADYELFRPHLTSFGLEAGERLQRFGAMVEQVVFPHGGLVAMTMPLGHGGGGGAIPVGRDGILGAFAAAAAVPAMCDAQVYIPGRAASMSASAFRYVLDQSPTIRRLIGRYTAALMVQAHQTALCNAAHPVEARISRALLEVVDRCDGVDVPLAQNTLAQMLGVQRTTVNLAAGRLEDAGVIQCGRGHMRIVGRKQLERHACECYFNIKSYVSGLFALPVAAMLSPTPAEEFGRKA
jgi:CRP-like cAMP-binding protein